MKEAIFVTLSGLFLLLLMLIGIYLVDKIIICPAFGNATNLKNKYSLFGGGCFVQYEGQWIKKESLRGGKIKLD